MIKIFLVTKIILIFYSRLSNHLVGSPLLRLPRALAGGWRGLGPSGSAGDSSLCSPGYPRKRGTSGDFYTCNPRQNIVNYIFKFSGVGYKWLSENLG